MTEIRKRAFVGIVGLVSAGFFAVGCGSSSSTTGGGGTTGHAGTSGGGGSTGSAGTSGGGVDAAPPCTKAPTNGIIADFMGDGGIEIMGGLTTYGGVGAPTYAVASDVLTVTENVGESSAPQYVGQVLYFNDCVDASAFSGVEFMFGGTFSCPGGSIQYSSNDAPHDDVVTDPTKGKCTLGTGNCYSPQAAITTVMSNAVNIQEAWPTTAGGAPSLPTDPTQLTGLQWQITVPKAGDGAAGTCMGTLNISAIKFY